MTIDWVDAGIPANERVYTRMTSLWPRHPRIQVAVQGAQTPIRLPLEFIQASGDNTWHLVHRMVSLLVNESGQIQHTTGDSVVLEAEPEAGEYLFAPLNGNKVFTWRQGPTGAREGYAIVVDESDEDSSAGACSADKARFRELVLSRDVWCLLTKRERHTKAVHIVPARRLDIYRRVLDDIDVHPHERSMGILLSLDMQAGTFIGSGHCTGRRVLTTYTFSVRLQIRNLGNVMACRLALADSTIFYLWKTTPTLAYAIGIGSNVYSCG